MEDRRIAAEERRLAREGTEQVAVQLRESREVDALERQQVARVLANKVDVAVSATRQAHENIANLVVENTNISKEAFKVANGHNEKIAHAVQFAAAVPEIATRAALAAVAITKKLDPTPTEQPKIID